MSDTRNATDDGIFDYVIVGAGAAGCVLASRLSENPETRVCLLEAGPEDRSMYIGMPAGFVKVSGNARYTWNFATEGTAQTAGRSIALLQGKTLGGGTSVNGMAFNRGQRTDFDGWASQGNPGWSYHDLLPVFRDIESRDGGDPDFRGRNGPVAVTDVKWDDGLCRAFVDGAVECGIPRNADTNGERQEGVTFSQVTIKNHRRVSASSAFLRPARRRGNLRVVTEALATRVLFEQKRATGVVYQRGNALRQVRARCEVIVACGAINTPRLLQVSGVGDAQALRDIGAQLVHHLPGVGANLQDHYMALLIARGRNFRSINQFARAPQVWWQALRWTMGMPGILSLPVALVHYFFRSGLTATGDADVQGIFTPASHMTSASGTLDKEAGMTCAVWQHRPLSRGYVKARSTQMSEAPLVQPNYLDHEIDRQILIAACRKTREILTSDALKPFFETEMLPGNAVQSDDEWLDFIRQTGSTVFHPVGTAKMGPATDATSVVDSSLRVHGLQGLRVADSSIMPSLTSGNTAAISMVIGEKAARLILANRTKKHAA
ncbi:GMC family oxidoreductase N-terminal domain-containing protein [Burkholderia multivorans]|uniref:Choline dehydrogenase n=1 Tax=Burkholderia multivorans TaxID=87883 RepID=A0AB37ATL1_9BURK|nr:GMC family oxidoreductase N-terminal domain-containing protein [Burkholderia multivorans]MBU9346583.1 GMC family oxidoreductase N-terminal domain-containing protein [Burkholderia multivorans]MCO1383877.1 GMC family oxidoreductase N-terminal domain-containing protein [Burkholderia multivorans]MCO1400526.1 GMC family oxidoreductase N-terminal domain-containing protein [Burkholderia multivorans]MDN7969753.1 GMC family oxidoreductase N-terminal domain-containing protein [Burkholderia multivorans